MVNPMGMMTASPVKKMPLIVFLNAYKPLTEVELLI
jgi:hypothetical protein